MPNVLEFKRFSGVSDHPWRAIRASNGRTRIYVPRAKDLNLISSQECRWEFSTIRVLDESADKSSVLLEVCLLWPERKISARQIVDMQNRAIREELTAHPEMRHRHGRRPQFVFP